MEYFPLPSGDREEIELPPVHLLPDARTRVLVTDSDGVPLPAAVYALPGEKAPWGGETEEGWRVASRFGWIGQDGELVLPRAVGERLNLYMNPLGTGRIERAMEMEHARFFLPEPVGRPLEVRVRTNSGPVPEAVVAIGDIAWPIGLTGADGRLTVSGVRRRVLSFVVLSKEGAVVRRTVDRAKLAPDQPITIALPEPRQISGLVVDGHGRPLPGALVWMGSDPGRFGLSNGQGELDLTAAHQRRVWIQGHADNHLPGVAWVERGSAAAGRFLLGLDRALRVDGRVVDASGQPVPGVDVVVDTTAASSDPVFRRDPRFARARSDSDGRFNIDLRHGDTYAVAGTRAGYRTARAQLAVKSGMETDFVLRLEQHRGGWGRVLDWRERPAAGVTVWLVPAGAGNRLALETRARRGELDQKLAAETDEEGLFRFDHLPAREVDLAAYGSGFAPTVVPGISAASAESSGDLGTIVLRRGLELSGRVVDELGDPIHGASVWLLDAGQSIARQQTDQLHGKEPEGRSGADGSFLLEDFAPETAIRLGIDADGFRPAVVDVSEVDERKTIKIILERQGLLRGRVLDPEGLPVSGARVTVSQKEDETGLVGGRRGMDAERTALTSENGAFEISELPGGTYRIEAFRDGFLASSAQAVVVAPGAPAEDIELQLRIGASVEGWVATELGEPVEGAVVILGRPAARTGADGSFLVEGVETGSATIEVRHPDFAWHEETREIEPGTNLVELELQAGSSVSGATVRTDGEVVAGVRVRLTRQVRPFREYATSSAQDGTFRFASVQPGVYRLEAEGESLIPIDPAMEVDVGPEAVEDLSIRLRAGATIRGAILGLELDELSRVHVVASNPERHAERGNVAYSGAYRIEPVGPGVWWVRASLPGGTKEAEARVVIDDETGEVVADLDMASGFALRGVVLVDGEPSAGVQVSLAGIDRSTSRQGRSDLEGHFQVANLQQGRYRLTATDPRTSLIHNELIDLFDDREVVVRVESAKVLGTVTSKATGEALQDTVVTLGQLEGAAGGEVSRVALATDDRGAFRIDKLSAGRYRLSVRRDGYASRVSELEVHAGESVDLDIALAPAAGLRLRVRDPMGSSPAWAYVRVSDPQGGYAIEETRSLEAERLVIPTVPPGTWDVLLAAPGGAPVELRVAVPGEPADVVLPPGGRLRLQAPVLEELGLEGTVQVLDAGGHPIRALDLETGTLRWAWPWRRYGIVIDSVPAGQWVVRVESTGGATWNREVTIQGSEEALVVLR